MDFLGDRKGLACKISGKAALGETSSTMADYLARLEDRLDAPHKDNPGTFFLDTPIGQAEVSAAPLSSHGGLYTVPGLCLPGMVLFTTRYSILFALYCLLFAYCCLPGTVHQVLLTTWSNKHEYLVRNVML